MLNNYWLLPNLFILHELEEVLFVPFWKKYNEKKLKDKNLHFFGSLSTFSSFFLATFEEYIILILLISICYYLYVPILYLAILSSYTIHFSIHVRMCLQFKKYVPGIVTALIEIPILTVILYQNWNLLHREWALYLILVMIVEIIFFMNLKMLHNYS